MTIEDITGVDASVLEALTDAQILELYKPYLTITRPELAIKPEGHKVRSATSKAVSKKLDLDNLFSNLERKLAEKEARLNAISNTK